MKKIVLLFLLVIFFGVSKAQSTHDVMVSGGLDVLKTDNVKLFNKAQIGLEANYFVVRHFSVGAGLELWTKQKDSFVMGMRWYANDSFFFRFRGLIGTNDAALGAGWSKPIATNWRFEAIGDYYFEGDFALRAGVSYIIK
jgi:hypothetical protein